MYFKNLSESVSAIIGAFSVFYLALSLVGCGYISVQTRQELGVPQFPPTNPASVQITRLMPDRQSVRLGEITLEPSDSATTQEIEAKLKDAAAKIGANAAVIVSDRTELMGASITGGFANRQLTRDYQRVIVAVAERYTDYQ